MFIRKGLESPPSLGYEPRFGGPEFLKKSIKESEEIAAPILKELGLYVEK
jgi:hypothetical protein